MAGVWRVDPPVDPLSRARSVASDRLDFLLFGPLTVRRGSSSLQLGGPKQRALLALLLIEANRPVSSEWLIDNLWGTDAPPTAAKAVQVYVSRLRRVLGEDADRLQTRGRGYLIRVAGGEVDLLRFEELVSSAQRCLALDPPAAGRHLRAALELCVGPPLTDLADEPSMRLVRRRLDEERLAAIEQRAEIDLTLGENPMLIEELRVLVASDPFRERLSALLMRALYRSGRQAEALGVYAALRATLSTELGIEPNPDLARLQSAILRQDPDLDNHSRPSSHPANAAPPDLGHAAHSASALSSPALPVLERTSSRLRRLRRRGGPLVAAALAIAAVAVADGQSGTVHGPGVAVVANSLAILDENSAAVVADPRVSNYPASVVVADGSAWVASGADKTIMRISLKSRLPTRTFGLPDEPVALTAGSGVVWIGDGFNGRLSRILTRYDQLSAPTFPGKPVAGLLAMAAAADDLWVGVADNELVRLDASNLQIRSAFTLAGRPAGIVVLGHAVWNIWYGEHTVHALDSTSGREVANVALPNQPILIAAGHDDVWVVTAGDDELWKIDATTGAVVGSTPLGLKPTGIAVAPEAVWVAGGNDGILERVDPSTGEIVRTVRLGRPIGGIAVTGPDVLLTVS